MPNWYGYGSLVHERHCGWHAFSFTVVCISSFYVGSGGGHLTTFDNDGNRRLHQTFTVVSVGFVHF